MKLAKIRTSCVGAFLLVGMSTTHVGAQELQGWWNEPWRFSFKGYSWLPKAPATIKVDQDEVANLPETDSNILDGLELAAMFELEAHKGRLGFFASAIYYDGKDSEKFTGLLGERRKVTLKETVWLVNYGVSYEIGQWRLGEAIHSPTVTVEPFVGGLYFHDPIRIDVSPGLLDSGLKIRKTVEFNTPIAGLNAKLQFNDRWSLRVSGNHGVFNSSKVNKTWQGLGLLGYHFKIKNTASQLFAGYRYTHIDYEDGPLEIDVDVKGPLIGFGVEF